VVGAAVLLLRQGARGNRLARSHSSFSCGGPPLSSASPSPPRGQVARTAAPCRSRCCADVCSSLRLPAPSRSLAVALACPACGAADRQRERRDSFATCCVVSRVSPFSSRTCLFWWLANPAS